MALPSYVSTSATEEPTVTFAPRREPRPDDPELISPQEAALRARIDTLDLAPSTTLTTAYPAVLRTAARL